MRGLPPDEPLALPAGNGTEVYDAEVVPAPDGDGPVFEPPWVRDAKAEAEHTRPGTGLMTMEDAVVQLASDGSQPRHVRSRRATG